jgi:hypothetical protein
MPSGGGYIIKAAQDHHRLTCGPDFRLAVLRDVCRNDRDKTSLLTTARDPPNGRGLFLSSATAQGHNDGLLARHMRSPLFHYQPALVEQIGPSIGPFGNPPEKWLC